MEMCGYKQQNMTWATKKKVKLARNSIPVDSPQVVTLKVYG